MFEPNIESNIISNKDKKGAKFVVTMQQNGSAFRIYSKKDSTTFITTHFVD